MITGGKRDPCRRDSHDGRIFDLQRFSTHDGPGIRTTVFLKGCPLRCLWCHNPEGLDPDLQLSFLSSQCVGCGECRDVCPNHAHRIELCADRIVHTLERPQCRRCGWCAAACVSGALEQVGRDVSVAEVLREVLADRAFYGLSGGGLTLSGGEPLLQADFTAAVLQAAKDQGIHCCLETSGYARWQQWEGLVSLVDLFLYDYKETDPQRHVEYTGVSNALILENLRALYARGAGLPCAVPSFPAATTAPTTLLASWPWPERCRLWKRSSYYLIIPWGARKASDSGLPGLPQSPGTCPTGRCSEGGLTGSRAVVFVLAAAKPYKPPAPARGRNPDVTPPVPALTLGAGRTRLRAGAWGWYLCCRVTGRLARIVKYFQQELKSRQRSAPFTGLAAQR